MFEDPPQMGLQPSQQPANYASQQVQSPQIPYDVYQTVHRPTARRRRWTFRVAAAAIVAALVVAGVIALRRGSNNPNTTATSSSSQVQPKSNEPGGSQKPSQQAPQSNTPLAKADDNPVTASQNSAKNTTTVSQPE